MKKAAQIKNQLSCFFRLIFANGLRICRFTPNSAVFYSLELVLTKPMKTKTPPKEKPYVMSRLKTYSAEEILRAGGTTAFAKLTGYDPKKLYHLKGEPLTEEEYQKALKMLTK